MAKKQFIPSETIPPEANRTYKGTRIVDHDLFKLKVASLKRNISYTDIPTFESVEHTHFFHTYDSDGRQQTYASSVGGHTHKVTWERSEGGDLIGKCGPAIKVQGANFAPAYAAVNVKMRNPNTGLVEKTNVPDDHTHEVEYLFSEKINARVMNPDSVRAMDEKLAYERACEAPLPQ